MVPAMAVKYHFIGGPNDGLVASLPYLVEEISLPSEEPPVLDSECDKNVRCHGHPYSHNCRFHLYLRKSDNRVRGCYDMIHNGMVQLVDDDNELKCKT